MNPNLQTSVPSSDSEGRATGISQDFAADIPAQFAQYVLWSRTLWFTGQGAHSAESELAIMTLGFGGECGEVAECLRAAGKGLIEAESLCKELGDVIYYWARLADTFELDTQGMAQQALNSQCQGGMPESAAFIEFSASVGRVLELLKKRIRDNTFELEVFRQAMAQALSAWIQLCWACGHGPVSVLKTNRDKLEDRFRRNTLRGSGDNR